MEQKYSSEQKSTAVKAETSKNKQVEVVSINQPSREDSKIKIKELSEFLSMAWTMPNNSE